MTSRGQHVVVLLLMVWVAFVVAQEVGQFGGEVISTVDGSPNRPLGNVTVTLTPANGLEASLSTTTDPDGRFRLSDLPVGVYRLEVSRQQQSLGTASGIEIGRQTRLVRILVPSDGGPLRLVPFATAAARPPPPPPPPTALPPPAPGPPAPGDRPGAGTLPSPGLAVVPVFYATDREVAAGATLAYGSSRNRSGDLYLGRFDVSIPRDHRVGQVERPSIWTFWREDPSQHLVITNRTQRSYEDFYSDVRGVVGRSSRKEAFVFVHGFNVSFEGAVFRTAQIAYDLGFDGAPILYSWPSAESLTPIGYATDGASADWTAPHLRWFLEDVAAKTGAARVHLIAHSMGNKALVNALDRMSLSSTRRFSQIVLTAPDIDADTFVQLADAVKRNGQMATLYASANDAALLASKKLQTYRRAGDTSGGVVVVPGIDTVDVSDVDTDLIGHFYYGDNMSVISDLFLVLSQGIPPAQRPRLRASGTATGRFWRFVP